MSALSIYWGPEYNATDDDFDTLTKAGLVAGLVKENGVPGVRCRQPEAVSVEALEEVHSRDYVDAVRTGEPRSLAEGNNLSWCPRLFDAVRSSTGGMVAAALAALAEGSSGSLSSGLHHARRDRGNGYCTFNGLVLAALAAIVAGAARVLILDLDAHCGGGTASLIEGIGGVEQVDVSVNPFDHYESRPDARLVMADGHDYLDVVERELRRIEAPGSFDLVIYNAGMDPHEQAGGVTGIRSDTLAEREDMVFQWAAGHGLPVAFALAGGYQSGGFTLDDVAGLHLLTIETAARWSR